jgi:hypothetical protein
METFTITHAARLLEKDRETLVRALKHTPPDTVVKTRGRDRDQWRMSTIVAALERNSEGGASSPSSPRRKNGDGWRDERITKAYDGVLQWYDELQSIEDLEQRRTVAREKVAPLIAYNCEHLRDWMIENGHGAELAGLSSERLWHMSRNFVRFLCEWTDEEEYDEIVIPQDDWSEDELREHQEKRKEQRKKMLAKLIAAQSPSWKKAHAFDL